MAKTVAWFDSKLGKFISRTLCVFICASGFLWLDKIGEDNWALITMVYLAGQKGVDALVEITKAKYNVT